jgi:hypothetical protein
MSFGSATGAISSPSAWNNNVVNNFAVNYGNGGLNQGDIHTGDIGN